MIYRHWSELKKELEDYVVNLKYQIDLLSEKADELKKENEDLKALLEEYRKDN